MAKNIYINQAEADKILEDVKKCLLYGKHCGSVSIVQKLASDSRKAKILFTADAWIKLTTLVSEFFTEVQWHGLVERVDDNTFKIYDIIVPPHTVTSVTVTSDQAKYTEWLNDLDDDTFNALRFHGHSHVNMDCDPSGTDMEYRKDIITQLPKPKEDEDTFYMFFIFNKKGSWSGEVYDLTNNAIYSSDQKEIDISVVMSDDTDISEFISDAKKVAVAPTTTYKSGSTYTGGTKSYGGGTTASYQSTLEKKSDKYDGWHEPEKKKEEPKKQKKSTSESVDDCPIFGGACIDCGRCASFTGDDSQFDPTDPFGYKEGRYW